MRISNGCSKQAFNWLVLPFAQRHLGIYVEINQNPKKYFYTLGLNKKFCNGIRLFLANETLSGSYKPFIRKIVNDWKSNECDQVRNYGFPS